MLHQHCSDKLRKLCTYFRSSTVIATEHLIVHYYLFDPDQFLCFLYCEKWSWTIVQKEKDPLMVYS